MRMRAIIPGSFDPMTTGHLSLVTRASKLFESVTVLVCINFDKKYMFSPEQRLEIARASVGHLDNVEAELYTGWLYEYLNSHKPCVLVKGVRNVQDFEYEKTMAGFNLEKSGVETVLLFSEKDEVCTSSTKVREFLEKNDTCCKLIPQSAQKLIEKFYAENRKK